MLAGEAGLGGFVVERFRGAEDDDIINVVAVDEFFEAAIVVAWVELVGRVVVLREEAAAIVRVRVTDEQQGSRRFGLVAVFEFDELVVFVVKAYRGESALLPI